MTPQAHDSFGSALSARGLSVNALFAALLAASAILALPVPGLAVPVTLQLVVVVLIALIVPPAWAAASVGTYLLAGAVGLPVFARLHGGIAVLVGPTGGYLLGFLLGTVAGAWVLRSLRGRASATVADVAAAVTVIACVYLVGWLQLMLVSGTGPAAALLGGVAPFVVPDGIKAAAAVAVAPMVRRASRL